MTGVKDLVSRIQHRILPLKKQPQIPAISTKQTLVANRFFPMLASQFRIPVLTITSV